MKAFESGPGKARNKTAAGQRFRIILSGVERLRLLHVRWKSAFNKPISFQEKHIRGKIRGERKSAMGTSDRASGGIQVCGMQFGYDGKPLFVQFNLEVSPGSRCLLIGANGSGKLWISLSFSQWSFNCISLIFGSLILKSWDMTRFI